ncbi:MAG TPA: GntR family transcriptional regulator [Pseudogracilibacillus sp.]|nr:GntR family transcriptional regulator [Pseudogracilibacillus sp.]
MKILNQSDLIQLQSSLGETVANLIKKNIWMQEYKLGERLLEKDQAEKFNVSRSTIREAFTILENQGLIVNKARKGTYVAHYTEQDLKELIELRILIEKNAVVKALPLLTEIEFTTLSNILEVMKNQIESADWYELFNLDLEFHNTIVRACGNTRIIKIFELNQIEMRTYLGYLKESYSNPIDLYTEHLNLFRALQTKDLAKVTQAIEDHIMYAEEKLLDNLTEK